MRYVIAIFVLVFAVGCVKRDSIRYVTLPAKPIEQVELLPGPPQKPFKVVGHVFVKGSSKASWQSVAEGAKAEAAEMGADAVFMGNAGEYQAGAIISSTTITSGTTGALAMGIEKKQFTGIAIVYQQP